MTRINGITDYIGPSGGFSAHGGAYLGVAKDGIRLDASSGVLSGLSTEGIYFRSHSYMSGVAGGNLVFGTSGNLMELRTFNGGNIDLRAEGNINTVSTGGDILVADDADITVRSTGGIIRLTTNTFDTGTDIISEAYRSLSGVAGTLGSPGWVGIGTNPGSIHIIAKNQMAVSEGNIQIDAEDNIDINALNGTFSLDCNALSMIADGDWDFRGNSESDRIFLAEGALNLHSLGRISGVADTSIGFIGNDYAHLASSGTVFLTANSAINLFSNGYMSGIAAGSFLGLQTNDFMHLKTDSGGTFRVDARTVNIDGSNSARLEGGPVHLALGGFGNPASLTGVSAYTINAGSADWDFSGNMDVDLNGLSSVFDLKSAKYINFNSGDDLTINSAGNILSIPRNGKLILGRTGNRAVLNISGVASPTDAIGNSMAEGDLGYINASSDVDRGQGRLWMNTGSGLAPLSIGSGIGAAVANSTTTITATGSSAHTAIAFGSNIIVDKQFQKPNNTTFVPTQNGLYKITFSISYQNTTGTIATVRTWIVVNGSRTQAMDCVVLASGFGTVGSAALTIYKYLNAGSTVQIGASKILGAGATVATGSNLATVTITQVRPSF